MKDSYSFGKFTLGIVTSVSLTAMTFIISKTTPDNKNSYDNDVMYTPPYRRIYFEKGQITTNEKVSPAYNENINYISIYRLIEEYRCNHLTNQIHTITPFPTTACPCQLRLQLVP